MLISDLKIDGGSLELVLVIIKMVTGGGSLIGAIKVGRRPVWTRR